MKKVLSFTLAMLLFLSMLTTGIYPASADSVTIKTVGDLDQDGEVSDWDSVLLDRYLAGWAVNVADEKMLDIDGDGTISESDSVLLHRYLADWSVSTQVGERLTYTITYENTKDAVCENPTSYVSGSEAIQLSELSAEHYIFDGWYIGDERITHIPTGGVGNLTITAHWTPVEYTITYVDSKDAENYNPKKYHIDSNSIVLQNLTCDGYIFGGWYNGNTKVTQIPAGSTGDITLTAKWSACDYTITYENTKGATNNNPNSFTIDSDTITLVDLEKEGYIFDGWYNGNEKITKIPVGTIGNITLTAQWTPISYTATFIAEGSVVAIRYFTIEDKVISNIPNVPSKAGYTGVWSNYSLGTSNVVIPAVYSLNEYSITYTNTKGADNDNLTKYTVITDTFNLSDLQCDGYEFVGWYTGSKKVTSIEKGTTGNITLTAKWTATDYLITYTDTKGAVNTNPAEYNVETGTIYLANIATEHYTFNGWYLNGKKVTSIPAGSIGDIELVARWTPVSYSLTYKNTKGATNTNPATYTVEDMIILQDLSADGYTFEGWYIGDEKVTTISLGSYGSKTLTAKWTAITYFITYQDELNLSHSNPATYTVESDITLKPLHADGYTFDGWYNGNTEVTTIQAGSVGDLVLTAKWSIITYTITYENTKRYANSNPTEYTVENDIVLADLEVVPYRLGYVFDGWYNGSEKVTQINAGSYGNLTLSAKWIPFVYEIVYQCEEGVDNPNTLSGFVTVESFPVEEYELLDPSRDGYTFDGWICRTDDGITHHPKWLSAGGLWAYTRSNGQIILEPEWIPNEYSVEYVSAYDVKLTHTNPTTYTPDDMVTLADATVDHFTFEGWYADATFETPVTTIGNGMFGDLKLYAKLKFEGTYIRTAQDFANIVYDMSGGYMLSSSITITEPLGDETNPFTGYFYGNGFRIRGSEAFSINKGRISNVGTDYLLCDTNSGTIDNCNSKGGIARINSGTIYRCKSTGYVSYSTKGISTIRGEKYYYDSITQKYHFDKYITAYQLVYQYIGGLVAYNDSTGKISQCEVVHKSAAEYTIDRGSDYISTLKGYVGGFAGYSKGTIEDSYYSGVTLNVACINNSYFANSNSLSWNGNYDASAYLYCGGFIGCCEGNISRCYANLTSITGKVNGRGWSGSYNELYGWAEGYLGGFAGAINKVSKSFSNVETISYDVVTSSLCSYKRCIGTSCAKGYSADKCEALYYNSNCSLSQTGVTSSKNYGTATNTANFKTRNFMVNTIGWSEDVWTFVNGSLPKLAWK